eukprot:CAMPEP_0198197358 /NCGR_PEP_ID=MMETSP1445-20131203/982_1 /TAXON_ID=36898 /ORGANISM="Pyramimonas sp., Strain CCMP2087" /LENGTH=307 /DNA_ID=CAMNT_0043866629 /DNA_START=129 /DNA_END=1052 /DNA_ORIENTATION=-
MTMLGARCHQTGYRRGGVCTLLVDALLLLMIVDRCTGIVLENNAAYQACLSDPASCVTLTASSLSLTGTLPTELGLFTALKVLFMEDNSFTGTLPTELGAMTKMQELSLRGNLLSGPIPTELGQMTRLIKLILWNNRLTGTIPSSLASMTDLTKLRVNKNRLSGTVPTELGSMKKLSEIWLNNNALTGGLPSELALLTAVTELYVHDNSGLCGPIPSGITLSAPNDAPADAPTSGTHLNTAECVSECSTATPTYGRNVRDLKEYVWGLRCPSGSCTGKRAKVFARDYPPTLFHQFNCTENCVLPDGC